MRRIGSASSRAVAERVHQGGLAGGHRTDYQDPRMVRVEVSPRRCIHEGATDWGIDKGARAVRRVDSNCACRRESGAMK